MELKKKAISGVRWVSVATVLNAVLQLLFIMILARYVSKKDFGLMALVQVVIEFSSYFLDMGFSNIVIHKQDISRVQLSSLYWLNVASGVVIYIVIFGVSPLLSGFYNEPGLTPLLNLVALTFLIIPFGQQHKILMQKELRFDTISKIEVVSRALSSGLGIIAGILHYGIYALIVQAISNSLISTGMLLYAGLKNHRPQLIYSHKALKGMYSFGFYQLGERSLNYFSGQFDTIIIGKMFGADPLGLYSIAKNLVMRPQQIITPIVHKVTFPVLAKVQDDTPVLRKSFIASIDYMSAINFPLHMGLFILAGPLTRVLFGDKWDGAIDLVRILSVFAMIRSLYSTVGSLLFAKGRADLGFRWIVFYSLITIPLIFAGGLISLQAVCYAQVITMVILFYPFYSKIVRPLTEAGFAEYHKGQFSAFILSVIASLIPFAAAQVIHNNILSIAAVMVTGLAGYSLLVFRYNRDLISMIKNFAKF